MNKIKKLAVALILASSAVMAPVASAFAVTETPSVIASSATDLTRTLPSGAVKTGIIDFDTTLSDGNWIADYLPNPMPTDVFEAITEAQLVASQESGTNMVFLAFKSGQTELNSLAETVYSEYVEVTGNTKIYVVAVNLNPEFRSIGVATSREVGISDADFSNLYQNTKVRFSNVNTSEELSLAATTTFAEAGNVIAIGAEGFAKTAGIGFPPEEVKAENSFNVKPYLIWGGATLFVLLSFYMLKKLASFIVSNANSKRNQAQAKLASMSANIHSKKGALSDIISNNQSPQEESSSYKVEDYSLLFSDNDPAVEDIPASSKDKPAAVGNLANLDSAADIANIIGADKTLTDIYEGIVPNVNERVDLIAETIGVQPIKVDDLANLFNGEAPAVTDLLGGDIFDGILSGDSIGSLTL